MSKINFSLVSLYHHLIFLNVYIIKINPYLFFVDVFIKLSDEMVLSIFRWLPKRSLTRCSLVCKRWHQIASDEVLWTRFDLASRPIQSGSMVHILNRKPLILRLAQADIRTPIFPCERPRESRLQFLDLSMAVLTAEGI